MVGLDGAGKTTTLFKLKTGEVIATKPTVGFNVENVEHGSVLFTIWDVGGQDKIRPLWRHYYETAQCVIFVVDSVDRERFPDAREDLRRMFAEDDLARCIFLVFANKQDLPAAVNAAGVTDALEIAHVKSHPIYVQECSAHTGAGLSGGLDWLRDTLKAQNLKAQAKAKS